jgi:hypothetical protein
MGILAGTACVLEHCELVSLPGVLGAWPCAPTPLPSLPLAISRFLRRGRGTAFLHKKGVPRVFILLAPPFSAVKYSEAP